MAQAKTARKKSTTVRVKAVGGQKPTRGIKAQKSKTLKKPPGWWQTVATMDNKGRSKLNCLKIKRSPGEGIRITMTAKQAFHIGQQMLELLTRPEVDISNPDGVIEMTCYNKGGVAVMGRRKSKRREN